MDRRAGYRAARLRARLDAMQTVLLCWRHAAQKAPSHGMKDDDDKDIDLTKQEYWETKKGAPILGRNGPQFLLELFVGLLVGIPVFCVANYLIRGEWPEFAVRLVQSIH